MSGSTLVPRQGALALLGGALLGCSSQPPLATVDHVDLSRFMGDWYVIAHIPASSEAQAFNGVESYRMEEDGTIATTYAFRDGGFDGPIEVMNPNAVVRNTETNATWGMQFFWPLRFEYLVTYLDEDYTATIIGRTARDYAWIMTRTPEIPEAKYRELIAALTEQGYDPARVRRVPHRWPDPEHPSSL
ncbi:MAG: lipocalin family protein [Planctomycetota bacterium]